MATLPEEAPPASTRRQKLSSLSTLLALAFLATRQSKGTSYIFAYIGASLELFLISPEPLRGPPLRKPDWPARPRSGPKLSYTNRPKTMMGTLYD